MKKICFKAFVLSLVLLCFSCDKLWNDFEMKQEMTVTITTTNVVKSLVCVGEDVLEISEKFNSGYLIIRVDADTMVLSRAAIREVACKMGSTEHLFTKIPFEMKDTVVFNPNFIDSLKINVKYMRDNEVKETSYLGEYNVSKE